MEYGDGNLDEGGQKEDAMLRVLQKVFWLAGDLYHEIQLNPEKSAIEYLKGRAFVDSPALWPHLPHIIRWWDEVGLPLWSDIDFLKETLAQIQEEDSVRRG